MGIIKKNIKTYHSNQMKYTSALILVAVLYSDFGVEAQSYYRSAICRYNKDGDNVDLDPEGKTIFVQKIDIDEEYPVKVRANWSYLEDSSYTYEFFDDDDTDCDGTLDEDNTIDDIIIPVAEGYGKLRGSYDTLSLIGIIGKWLKLKDADNK